MWGKASIFQITPWIGSSVEEIIWNITSSLFNSFLCISKWQWTVAVQNWSAVLIYNLSEYKSNHCSLICFSFDCQNTWKIEVKMWRKYIRAACSCGGGKHMPLCPPHFSIPNLANTILLWYANLALGCTEESFCCQQTPASVSFNYLRKCKTTWLSIIPLKYLRARCERSVLP